MIELLHFAFAPVNIPFTLLLIMVLLYWASVIVGVLDLGSLDIETDVHADLHHDVHVDKGVQVEVDTHVGWFGLVLAYFNVGAVPFMIVLSFVALFLWIGAILGNYYLGGGNAWVGLALFLPNLLASLYLAKWVTNPLKWVFREQKNEVESNHGLVGRTCTVVLPVNDGKIGQAEVAIQRGAPLLLTVKTTLGNRLTRGEKGLIIDYDENAHTYLIEPYDPGTGHLLQGTLTDQHE
jgi:membrane protein implicated in regulation of membrane protease activity